MAEYKEADNNITSVLLQNAVTPSETINICPDVLPNNLHGEKMVTRFGSSKTFKDGTHCAGLHDQSKIGAISSVLDRTPTLNNMNITTEAGSKLVVQTKDISQLAITPGTQAFLQDSNSCLDASTASKTNEFDHKKTEKRKTSKSINSEAIIECLHNKVSVVLYRVDANTQDLNSSIKNKTHCSQPINTVSNLNKKMSAIIVASKSTEHKEHKLKKQSTDEEHERTNKVKVARVVEDTNCNRSLGKQGKAEGRDSETRERDSRKTEERDDKTTRERARKAEERDSITTRERDSKEAEERDNETISQKYTTKAKLRDSGMTRESDCKHDKEEDNKITRESNKKKAELIKNKTKERDNGKAGETYSRMTRERDNRKTAVCVSARSEKRGSGKIKGSNSKKTEERDRQKTKKLYYRKTEEKGSKKNDEIERVNESSNLRIVERLGKIVERNYKFVERDDNKLDENGRGTDPRDSRRSAETDQINTESLTHQDPLLSNSRSACKMSPAFKCKSRHSLMRHRGDGSLPNGNIYSVKYLHEHKKDEMIDNSFQDLINNQPQVILQRLPPHIGSNSNIAWKQLIPAFDTKCFASGGVSKQFTPIVLAVPQQTSNMSIHETDAVLSHTAVTPQQEVSQAVSVAEEQELDGRNMSSMQHPEIQSALPVSQILQADKFEPILLQHPSANRGQTLSPVHLSEIHTCIKDEVSHLAYTEDEVSHLAYTEDEVSHLACKEDKVSQPTFPGNKFDQCSCTVDEVSKVTNTDDEACQLTCTGNEVNQPAHTGEKACQLSCKCIEKTSPGYVESDTHVKRDFYARLHSSVPGSPQPSTSSSTFQIDSSHQSVAKHSQDTIFMQHAAEATQDFSLTEETKGCENNPGLHEEPFIVVYEENGKCEDKQAPHAEPLRIICQAEERPAGEVRKEEILKQQLEELEQEREQTVEQIIHELEQLKRKVEMMGKESKKRRLTFSTAPGHSPGGS